MYASDGTILAALLGLIIIITFFVMAYRLKRIKYAVEALVELEKRKSAGFKLVQCPKCKHEFSVEDSKKGQMNCPMCKEIITL